MNKYMEIAIKEAKKAYKREDVPVGVVIVKNDRIISKAHNKRHLNKKITDHAEIIAINKATKKLKDWRLNECEMYVTLEPCLMCQAVIRESRIKKVVYSLENSKKDIVLNREITYEKISNYDEILNRMLKDFFKKRRK